MCSLLTVMMIWGIISWGVMFVQRSFTEIQAVCFFCNNSVVSKVLMGAVKWATSFSIFETIAKVVLYFFVAGYNILGPYAEATTK